MSKACEMCGSVFTRKPRRSESVWQAQRFCGARCANRWRAKTSNPMRQPQVRARHGYAVASGMAQSYDLTRRRMLKDMDEARRSEAAQARREVQQLRSMLRAADRLSARLERPCQCAACQAARGRESAKRWRRENPEAKRASGRRWRALNRGAAGRSTAEQDRARLEFYGERCAYCRTELNSEWHWDHVIPLSRGGTNWPANLRPACPACNMSKRNRLPSEWQG